VRNCILFTRRIGLGFSSVFLFYLFFNVFRKKKERETLNEFLALSEFARGASIIYSRALLFETER